MKVHDLIQSRKEIYTVAEETTVHEAARFLRERQIRSVGVCDRQGKLVGVVSQSDISNKVAAENKCPAWMRVTEIMTANPTAVSPETSLEECLLLMEKLGAFHLPVIDPKEGYRGMVSVKDLLSVIASDQKARADMLESYVFSKR